MDSEKLDRISDAVMSVLCEADKKALLDFRAEFDVRISNSSEHKREYSILLLEQATVQQGYSIYFARRLVEPSESTENNTGELPRGCKSAFDGLARAQEGLRKVMKELLAQLEEESDQSEMGLADLVQPLLEKAGDVLEDEVRCQTRSKKTQAKRDVGGRSSKGRKPAS